MVAANDFAVTIAVRHAQDTDEVETGDDGVEYVKFAEATVVARLLHSSPTAEGRREVFSGVIAVPSGQLSIGDADEETIVAAHQGDNRVIVSVGDEVSADDLSPDLVYVDLLPALAEPDSASGRAPGRVTSGRERPAILGIAGTSSRATSSMPSPRSSSGRSHRAEATGTIRQWSRSRTHQSGTSPAWPGLPLPTPMRRAGAGCRPRHPPRPGLRQRPPERPIARSGIVARDHVVGAVVARHRHGLATLHREECGPVVSIGHLI